MTDAGNAISQPLMELILALPAHWDMSPEGFKDPLPSSPSNRSNSSPAIPTPMERTSASNHTVSIGDQPLLNPMQAVMPMLTRYERRERDCQQCVRKLS